MLDALLLSLLSVSLPLIIGGIFSLLFKKKNESFVSSFIFLSIGSLTFLVCYNLLPDLYFRATLLNEFGPVYLILLVIGFLAIILLTHLALDKFVYKHKHDHDCHHEHDHGHIDVYLQKRKESLKKAGIALGIALFFHNFPEGMSLGIEVKENINHAINLAISLGFHNLVMGITMALPLIISGMKKRNVIILLLISSLPSIIGSISGYYLSGDNELLSFVLLCFSCSVLIFVIYEETKSVLNKNIKWYHILFLLIGAILAYLISLLHIHH